MAKSEFAPLLPHGPVTQVVPGLWTVDGTLPNMALNRRMFVWKAPDGNLVLHSVVRMDDQGMQALEALGRPTWLIVPNEGHRLDVRWYKARYPDAVVLAPRNAVPKVEQVIPVERTCEDALPALDVVVHRPDGMKDGYELVYEIGLPGGGRALIVNDVLAHPRPAPGLGGFMLKLLGPAGGMFGIPRIVRFFFGRDMKEFSAFVARLAAIPGVTVIGCSHGDVVTGDCQLALAAAAARIA